MKRKSHGLVRCVICNKPMEYYNRFEIPVCEHCYTWYDTKQIRNMIIEAQEREGKKHGV